MMLRMLAIALVLAHLPQRAFAEPEPVAEGIADPEPIRADFRAHAPVPRLVETGSIRLELSFAEWASDALRFGDLLLSTRVVAVARSFDLLASWVMAPSLTFGLAPDQDAPSMAGTVSVRVEPYFARSAKGLAARGTF
jgi:hypothetical protein